MANKTALIVEDDKMLLKALAGNLTERGFDVVQVFYPFANVPKDRFDFAIVDGLKGYEINVLKNVDAERRVLYSAIDEMVTKAKKIGEEAYLKPTSMSVIMGDER